FILVFTLYITGTFDLVILGRRPVGKVGAVQDRPVAILFAAEVSHEAHRVVYIVHIHRRIGGRTDKRSEISGIAEYHKNCTPDSALQQSVQALLEVTDDCYQSADANDQQEKGAS